MTPRETLDNWNLTNWKRPGIRRSLTVLIPNSFYEETREHAREYRVSISTYTGAALSYFTKALKGENMTHEAD